MAFTQIDKIDLIGVPLDLGVKELGLRLGPDALREVGLPDVARRLGLDVRDVGNILQPAVPASQSPNGGHVGLIAAYCRAVAEKVAESLEDQRVPICLGGDHSLTIGSLAGVSLKLGRVGCLWLDAHPDANTPETSPSGNVHGMPLAILLGHGPERLLRVGPPSSTLAYEDVALLGARDMDPGEVEFLRQHDVRMFTVYDVLEQGLPRVLAQTIHRITAHTEGVHVSLDLDVLHEDIAPGVGLPSHCGFDMREATYICQQIAHSCRITSIDVVGLNPVRDDNMRTARLAVELLMLLLGRAFSFNYDNYLHEQRHSHIRGR